MPQYIIITASEVMFSVTGLEFAYSQSPTSMKSFLQACWLLAVAAGNVLVVFIAEAKFFQSQASEFFLFAGMMISVMTVFVWLATRYRYVIRTSQNEQSDLNAVDTGDGVGNRQQQEQQQQLQVTAAVELPKQTFANSAYQED